MKRPLQHSNHSSNNTHTDRSPRSLLRPSAPRGEDTPNNETAQDDDDDDDHRQRRSTTTTRRRRNSLLLWQHHFRRYGVVVVFVFFVLRCLFTFTPPSPSSTLRASFVPLRSSTAITSAAAAASSTATTTIVECVVSTPHYQEPREAARSGSSRSTTTTETAEVVFHPVAGTLRITIPTVAAGSSAAAFLLLVDAQFYDGAYTFRALPNFIVQWGFQSHDSTTTFSAARARAIAAVKNRPRAAATPPRRAATSEHNEKNNNKNTNTNNTTTTTSGPPVFSNVRGTITMIAGNTGQVFINLKDNTQLDKEGTLPFGTIDIGSMTHIVDHIYTGYQGGSGQIEAIKHKTIADQFPKMSRIERCSRT